MSLEIDEFRTVLHLFHEVAKSVSLIMKATIRRLLALGYSNYFLEPILLTAIDSFGKD